MERTNYQATSEYTSMMDVTEVEYYLSKEERNEMNRKCNDVIGCLPCKDYSERTMLEKIFKFGYLAAHITPQKPQSY